MSHAVDFHGQVFVGDFQTFLVGNGFKNQALANLFFSSLFIVLADIIHGLADALQIIFHSGISGFHVQLDFIYDFIDALFNHFLRNIYFGVSYSLVDKSFMISFFCLLDSGKLHLLFNSGLQVIHGFKLADGFCKCIIKSRELFTFYITDMNGEFCFFTFQGIYEVVFRECDFHNHIIAGFMSFQLFFEARDKALGTDFQRISLSFAAFKGFAVNGSFKVDDSKVAFLQFCTIFCFFQSCILFSCCFELVQNLVIGDFRVFSLGFQTFIFTQFYFRTFYKGSSEISAIGFGELTFLHIRCGYRNQLLLGKSLLQGFIDHNVLGFRFYSGLAEMHFQDFTICLALTETGNSYLVRNAGYSSLESLLYNFSRQFNTHRNLVLIQCLNFYVHKKYSSLSRLTDKLIPFSGSYSAR